ncbi:glycosyltransferase family 4 protein [Pseudomonadales bacterium]|nr:glycosyltransferase family 4 protein [Pseudomonadales bacterium]
MHYAFIIDDYLPDSTRVGSKMLHELALEFLNRGHQITVITPRTKTQIGDPALVEESIDGVKIWRFRNGPVKGVGNIKRAINETLMSFNAWRAISSKIDHDKFDGVVYYSPSIFFGTLAKKIRRKCNCKSYLILRDLFPQWAIDAGVMKKNSISTKYFKYFESINYSSADSIGLMSIKNLQLFQSIYPKLCNTHVLFNWASAQPLQTLLSNSSIRERLDLDDKIIFFYGGNIGHAQDMANLIRLANGIKEHKKAHFLFIGQGDEVELIKEQVKDYKLDNVTILPSVSQLEFRKILCEVDVGLFSLSKNHTAHNFPGKILGYMVESLPILGSVNPGNDLQAIVNEAGAGHVFVNGEDKKLLLAANQLLDEPSMRFKQGNASFNLLHKYFSVTSASDLIINKLNNKN